MNWLLFYCTLLYRFFTCREVPIVLHEDVWKWNWLSPNCIWYYLQRGNLKTFLHSSFFPFQLPSCLHYQSFTYPLKSFFAMKAFSSGFLWYFNHYLLLLYFLLCIYIMPLLIALTVRIPCGKSLKLKFSAWKQNLMKLETWLVILADSCLENGSSEPWYNSWRSCRRPWTAN